MIENVIIQNEFVQENDQGLLFGDEQVHVTTTNDLPNLLVELGIYKSTSEARRANRIGKVPEGFTFSFKASKIRYIWIWNPTE